MHIARAELFELALPLVEQFIIPGGRIDARRSLIVVLHDDEGHTGYGESPPFELPFYSEETLAGAIDLTQRVLLPRIVGREFASPEALDAVLRDGVRGNRFARAGVETAAWDLEAHRRGVGLSQLVAATLAVEPAASVACGVALGIPDDRQPTTLQRRVYEALQLLSSPAQSSLVLRTSSAFRPTRKHRSQALSSPETRVRLMCLSWPIADSHSSSMPLLNRSRTREIFRR